MTLTPFHPLLRDGTVSVFPIDCPDAIVVPFEGYVFDFVLKNRGIVASPVVNPSTSTCSDIASDLPPCMFAATFGHGIQSNATFAHAYFGSEAVVQDLRMHPNWKRGEIVLNQYTFLREDAAERRVVGIQYTAPGLFYSTPVVAASENKLSNAVITLAHSIPV